MHSDKVTTTASESRKSTKPIMEKRRRARINASLAELKSLLLEVIKKEGSRHSKMEKADILEMTVKHLRQIQRQHFTGSADPTQHNKYKIGFNECVQEVSKYLTSQDFPDADIRARLLNHLANCISGCESSGMSSVSSSPMTSPESTTSPIPFHSMEQSVTSPQSPPTLMTPLIQTQTINNNNNSATTTNNYNSNNSMFSFLIFFIFTCPHILGIYLATPGQVHLSYGRNSNEMVVTWSTQNVTKDSTVKYGLRPTHLNMVATGYSTKFVDGGTLHHTQFIHRVTIKSLKPGQVYYYSCGGSSGWSNVFWFKAKRTDKDWSPSIALYGDLGNTNAQSLPRLKKEIYMYDAIFHIGDFAYNLDLDNGSVGDEFMQKIETVAAHLPYMTCPGNHENAYNFSNYKNRFTMPGDEDGRNMYYSFEMGPARFISISTEYYFFLQYGFVQPVKQFNWLEEQLKIAAKPENRARNPWIIVFGHRPMYCSNTDGDDCTHYESLIRCGVPFIHWLCMEKLFHKYGVDLAFWAHEHSYERLWPVYDKKVYNGSLKEPYTNPKAPVHIITGSAGCKEKHDNFQKNRPPWSAFRNNDYGYTRVQILNSSHIHIEQVSDDKGGQIIDRIMLIKDKHGPY